MSATVWETHNHSQFHTRRRACLAGCAQDSPGTAAVLQIGAAGDAENLTLALAGQRLEFEHVTDPAEALLVLGRTCPDVVVLAPTEGRLDPLAFLKIVRVHEPDLPIVVGVSNTDGGFAGPAAGLGAAVLAHPFDPDRLLRLLRSLLPARRHLEPRPTVLDLGRLRIDSAAPRIWLDDTLIKLPMREHLVLRYLAERRGAVVSRRELVDALWGENDTRTNDSLTVHVLRLRRRLGDDKTRPQWIEAVRGLGYLFNVPPAAPDIPRGDDSQ